MVYIHKLPINRRVWGENLAGYSLENSLGAADGSGTSGALRGDSREIVFFLRPSQVSFGSGLAAISFFETLTGFVCFNSKKRMRVSNKTIPSSADPKETCEGLKKTKRSNPPGLLDRGIPRGVL